MHAGMLLGGVVAAGGVLALFMMESKILGLIFSGVGVFFIGLSMYGDFSANRAATTSSFEAKEAEFDRDFAKASGEDKKTVHALSLRADKLRDESDETEVRRKEILKSGEEARKPLMDALTRQVKAAGKQDAESSDSGMTH